MILGLERLKTTVSNNEFQRGVITLYGASQVECTRNSKCGMEIGMSREKDLGAALKYCLGDSVNLDIDNDLPQDLAIDRENISVKHSQNKVGSPVKAKWTSADTSVQDAVKAMIEADDSYYPHLLLCYIDLKSKTIDYICITATQNKQVIKSLGAEAFKIPKGNSRGIEYSIKAMKELMKNTYFHIKVSNADLGGGIDPIQRRMNILHDMGIMPLENPESPAPSSQ